MGMSKYVTVKIKPTITASLQEVGAFSDDDVLFDWTKFQVPKGANRIIGVTALVRGTNGSRQEQPFDLYFASTDDNSLGTINATADGTGFYNDLIGYMNIAAAQYGDGLDTMAVVHSLSTRNILLPKIPGANNAGYDTFYVGGIAKGALDFSTNSETDNTVDVSGLSVPTITTLDGTACNLAFAVGDIIHVEDDIILGEVASLDANNITFKVDGSKQYHAGGLVLHTNPSSFSAWQTQNGAGAAGDLANNDELYNLHPITLLIHFEV